MGPETLFLKLGGSLITDKTQRESPRLDVLQRLAGEIAQARRARPEMRLLLGHGSGSFGHYAGAEYRTRSGIVAGQEELSWYGYAVTADAAARLDRLVIAALLAAGVPAVAFPPSASARAVAGRLEDLALVPIRRALADGLLPVVHGDVALDDSQGCTIVSTEEVFCFLASRLRATRIILAGTVDGVFTADPLKEPGARHIPVIHAAEGERLALGGSFGTDVTGGMASKVRQMAALVGAQPDLAVQILSGTTPGAVLQALLDRQAPLGTHVVA
jgi:isopentenyl phosphate kinase